MMASLASSVPNPTAHRPRTPPPPSTARRKYHAYLLILTLAVLSLAMVLSVQESGKVALPFLGSLPSTCAWRRLFQINCPGCGLTRCFVAVAHGDLARAWHYNAVGLLLFAVMLYQIPFRGIQLVRLSRGKPDFRHGPWTVVVIAWTLVAALFVQWGWRELL